MRLGNLNTALQKSGWHLRLAMVKIIFILLLPLESLAFKHNTFSLGFGYYSQNIRNKVSQDKTGKTGLLGEANYPVNLKYDFSVYADWFLAPHLSHTFLARKDAAGTTQATITHGSLLIGKNIRFGQGGSGLGGTGLDWYFGPGIIQHTIKGTGGTAELDNGTSTSTFAIPNRSSVSRKVTVNFGTSLSFYSSRLALDLIFENFFSTERRTQSMMLGYSYIFDGGGL